MSALKRFVSRTLNLFRFNRAERRFARELTVHVALLEDEYQRRGMSAADARRQAALVLGGVEQTKDLHRDARSFRWIDDLWRDAGYALRMLRRSPVGAAVAILSLALGIGLNSAVFAVVDWVLLRPLPYPHPHQLVRVFSAATAVSRSSAPGMSLTPDDFTRFGEAGSFASSAAFTTGTRILEAQGHEPVHAVVARIHGDLFATLGVAPVIGRSFRADELSGGAPVVVLGDELWRQQFHGDPSAVGRLVSIDGVVYTVVGVMPPNHHYPTEAQLWRPLTPQDRGNKDDREFDMVARLQEHVSLGQANAELAALAHGGPAPARIVWADDLQRAEVGHVRTALEALLASTLLVLLIVCANVAAVISARANDRAGEIAIRGALGATRARLVTQLTTESLVMALLGGALGLLAGQWTLQLLRGLAPVGLPRLTEVVLDPRILLAGLTMTVTIGIGVGLLPAFRLFGVAGSPGSQALGSIRWTRRSGVRRALVLVQAALAVMLTVGAGLLGRSLGNLVAIENGFSADHLIAADLSFRGGDVRQLLRDLTEQTAAIQGVRSAAVSMQLPTQTAGLRTQVRREGASGSPAGATLRPISPRYFEALDVPLLAGRQFTNADSRTAPPVAIVNETFVRDILGGAGAVGVSLTPFVLKAPLTVVGVVADLTPAGKPDRAALYVPADQVSLGGRMFLLVRTRDDPRAIQQLLRERIRSVAPGVATDRIIPVAEDLEASRSLTRFSTQLAASFAGLALLLSAIGAYGLVSGEVVARWRELAVRLALGALPRQALWAVIRPCALLLAAGAAIGVASALVIAPSFTSLLHGVEPDDTPTLVMAPLVLVSVGISAAVLASIRLLWTGPAETLRTE